LRTFDSTPGNAEYWNLRFLKIILTSKGGLFVRVNDESVFIQTMLAISQNTGYYATEKPLVNVWDLEISANYHGLISGICGNYLDGDLDTDLTGPEDNLIPENETLLLCCASLQYPSISRVRDKDFESLSEFDAYPLIR
jgi:hypothetical protein